MGVKMWPLSSTVVWVPLVFSLGIGLYQTSAFDGPSLETCQCSVKEDDFNRVQERLHAIEKILMNEGLMKTVDSALSITKERGIEEDVEKNTEDIATINSDLNRVHVEIDILQEQAGISDLTRPPVGSIVAWLPTIQPQLPDGWQRCDGSAISTGPLAGKLTPDLNTYGHFLRGGADGSAGTYQEDAVQDHQHADPGHTHQEDPHTHTDAGHSHKPYNYEDEHHEYFRTTCNDGDCNSSHNIGDGAYGTNGYSQTKTDYANIQSTTATIQSNTAGIGGISAGNVDSETRPKNMSVVYIIRII